MPINKTLEEKTEMNPKVPAVIAASKKALEKTTLEHAILIGNLIDRAAIKGKVVLSVRIVITPSAETLETTLSFNERFSSKTACLLPEIAPTKPAKNDVELPWEETIGDITKTSQPGLF